MPLATTQRQVPARRQRLQRRLLHFMVVAGPGLIVMVADNDAGAISTYTQAGAAYGTSLLWVLLLLLPVTYFVQEMVARLGIATGEGHAAMIYQRFGTWWGRFSLIDLLVVNFLTLVTEFAAVALGRPAPRHSSRHRGAAGRRRADRAGRHRQLPPVGAHDAGTVRPEPRLVRAGHLGRAQLARRSDSHLCRRCRAGGLTGNLVFLVIAIVGTTIAPWQLFFQQSCVADKRLRFADLKAARIDTAFGAVAVVAFAGCMMLVGDALFRAACIRRSCPDGDRSDPPHRPCRCDAILLLMVNAALLGATAISLSSAWAWGEVMGWRISLQSNLAEAPKFYAAYAVCVAAAAGVTLHPRRAVADHHPERAGAGRGHAAGRDRLPATAAERPGTAGRAVCQPALEQLGQLDRDRGFVRSVLRPRCPGAAARAIPHRRLT